MRLSIRAALCSIALIALAIAPNTALAAKPDYGSFSGSFTDPDFCGTGAAIDISFWGVFTRMWSADGSTTMSNQKVTFTNPANGMWVIQTLVGYEKVTETDLPDGTVLFEHSVRGTPSTLRTSHENILVKDAGYIELVEHVDGDGNQLSLDVVFMHGPHPDADADFNLFCGVMETALGI
jgi:hypothetical protein